MSIPRPLRQLSCLCLLALALLAPTAPAVEILPLPPKVHDLPAWASSMKDSLAQWDAATRDELERLSFRQEEAAALRFLLDSLPVCELENGEAFNVMRGALQDLMSERYEHPEDYPEKLREISAYLQQHGIRVVADGSVCYPLAEPRWFYRQARWSKPAAALIEVLGSEPADIGDAQSGPRCFSEDLTELVLNWERLIRSGEAGPYKELAVSRYKQLVELMFWCEDEDSRIYSPFTGYKMLNTWREGLLEFLREHPDTESARVIAFYLKRVEANDWELSDSIREVTQERIDQLAEKLKR